MDVARPNALREREDAAVARYIANDLKASQQAERKLGVWPPERPHTRRHGGYRNRAAGFEHAGRHQAT